jgi:hypothetical protein
MFGNKTDIQWLQNGLKYFDLRKKLVAAVE